MSDNYDLFAAALADTPSAAAGADLSHAHANPQYLNTVLETLGAESTRTALSPEVVEERVPMTSVASSLARKAEERLAARCEVKNSLTEISKNLVAVNRGKVV